MRSDSEHIDIKRGGAICHHLLDSDREDSYKQFTGVGTNYNLICKRCSDNLAELETTLRVVAPDQFEKLDRYPAEGFIGQPQVFERQTTLSFDKREVRFDGLSRVQIRTYAPCTASELPLWVVLLASGDLFLMDCLSGVTSALCTIAPSDFQMADRVALHISSDGQFAALVNDKNRDGVVFELSTGKITMRLDRQSYHAEQTHFPVAFFHHEGHSLLVHATDWNRLDISDPQNGALITKRAPTDYTDSKRPEHYLDYFHALPVISPNAVWIAEDGWVWQPFGVTRLWNLQRWLAENVWESEDGNSLRYITQRGYYWNGPLCWLDDQRLAVWGFGDDDLWLMPAVQIFDAYTGKRQRLFAGPKAESLYFDKYLFAVSPAGTEVWDAENGERLHQDSALIPVSYHPRAHEFMSDMGNGVFVLSRLVDLNS